MGGPKEAIGATEQLAAFAAATNADRLPDDLVHVLKRHLLDQLGIQLACMQLPWIKIATKYALTYGKDGVATLIGSSKALDAEYAAFANSVAGQGFELDDSATGASLHPGCVAVPTVLAIGEERNCTGLEALVALAIGFETILRVALAVSPSIILDRGFHDTCTEGVFGGALAAGWLMGFSTEQYVTALGIAGSHTSGTTEFAQSGGDVKRLHAGLGTMGGIRAARLAELGFTAPRAILEGKRGFLQAFCETYQVDAITDGLDGTWEFARRASMKVHACAGTIAPQIDAAMAAFAQADQPIGDIEEIVVGLDRKTMAHGGAIGPCPSDMTGAQFSVHFSVALAIVKGAASFDTYVEAGKQQFSDPEVLAVSKRVRIEHDSECEPEDLKSASGKVRIQFRNGATTQVHALRKGDPSNPVTDEEVEEKFFSLATRVITKSQAENLAEAVKNLERLESIRDLTRYLIP